jgi:hypothetical protein
LINRISDIKLNKSAQERLIKRHLYAQWKAGENRKKIKGNMIEQYELKSRKELLDINFTKPLFKLLCSYLFWTEGGKSSDSYVYFINSEEKMVSTFMSLIRKSFDLDEKKFRAMVHIHDYHDNNEIKKYWSRVTKIPLQQFSKSYNKPNTKKRKRKGYMGSIRIRYYDYKIALELRSYYNMFSNKILGV